jgi:hypothetical protein
VRKSNDLVEKEGAEVWMRRRKRMAYLLELLDGTLVDTTALVDQVTGGGRLTGVDVADNDDVNVSLFLTAGDGQKVSLAEQWRGEDIPHVDGCVWKIE